MFGDERAGARRRFWVPVVVGRGRSTANVTFCCKWGWVLSRGRCRRSSEPSEVCIICRCRLRGATPAGRSLSNRLAMYVRDFADGVKVPANRSRKLDERAADDDVLGLGGGVRELLMCVLCVCVVIVMVDG
jgi:hypothetical protein